MICINVTNTKVNRIGIHTPNPAGLHTFLPNPKFIIQSNINQCISLLIVNYKKRKVITNYYIAYFESVLLENRPRQQILIELQKCLASLCCHMFRNYQINALIAAD